MFTYINSTNYPPQLSESEERDLLEKLKQGSISARETLIERNIGLVIYIANKCRTNKIDDIDDLISIGNIGLIRAVDTFDMSKNIKLCTYASKCIFNEIFMNTRKRNNINYEISLYEPISTNDRGDSVCIADMIITEDNVSKYIENKYRVQSFSEAFNRLKSNEKELVRIRYGKRKATQMDTAIAMGISQACVSRREKRILNKLKYAIKRVE